MWQPVTIAAHKIDNKRDRQAERQSNNANKGRYLTFGKCQYAINAAREISLQEIATKSEVR